MKKGIFIGIVILLILGLCGYYFIFKKDNNKTIYKSINDVSDIENNVEGRIKNINWNHYSNKNIALKDSIKITKEGIYTLKGNIKDGYIHINTEGKVKLILNGVNITNTSGPAIYIENADYVEIYTNKNTNNVLSDASNYMNYDADVTSVIYSKDDLILSGDGILKINANYEDGIVSKDDLKIKSGTYIIKAQDDCIRAKDSLEIENGIFTVTSIYGDGLKSTNDIDKNKGFVLINNGNFNITVQDDGIDAQSKIVINNGVFNITTTSSSDSAKGIKAKDNIIIQNGVFNLTTGDDSIHSNNNIGIKYGTFNITSASDAIHADGEIAIDGGVINITKSYEGIEASSIVINDGNINIVSLDDGINIAGGVDKSSNNKTFNESNKILKINNGVIYINSLGDGIDANGSIYINGGDITIDGPTNNNGALDYDDSLVMTGGEVVASSSSSMAQNISNTSSVYGVLINFKDDIKNGSEVKIMDSNNKEVLVYKSSKVYSSLVVANKELQKGLYKILINNKEYTTFEISNITTTVGNIKR